MLSNFVYDVYECSPRGPGSASTIPQEIHAASKICKAVLEPFFLDLYSYAAIARKRGDDLRERYIILRRWGEFVHQIYWLSRKIRRYDSATAEIIAAADAIDVAL